jgi:hypothetical protein
MLILLTVLKLPLLLITLPYRGVRWLLRFIAELCRRLFRAIVATPGLVFIHGPVGLYRRAVRLRNWLLSIVETAQAESAKWRALFTAAKLPYTALRGLGLSPQACVSLLVAGSVAGGGLAAAEVMKPPSFAAGDTGIYSAPLDSPSFFSDSYNTLLVNLGTTAVKSLEISSVSVGTAFTNSTLPSGETTAISIGGDSTLGTPTWLIVGELVFEKNRCETLSITDVFAHQLNVTSNLSDGQSLAPVAGTIRDRAVLGGHGMAQDMSTTGGLYDRVVIQAPTTAVNGQVDKLTISNLYSKGGSCVLTRIKAGTLTISKNVIGGDSDLATKAFTIATSVAASVISMENNVEEVMAVPAVQTMDN